MPDLADEELFGLLGLGDVVDAGAAAAPVGLGEFDQLEARDELKELSRLLGHLLAVREVAGVVVGDGQVAQAGLRRPAAVLHHPLVDIAQLGVPELGQGRVDGVCGQQGAVVAEVIAAAARVRDDGVELGRREEVDHPLGQRLGRIAFAVVGVERAAARLDGRRVDFAAVGQKDVRGVAVDVGEDEVLDAAGQ